MRKRASEVALHVKQLASASDDKQRIAAARALGALGDAQAVPALIAAYRNSGGDELGVYSAVSEALGEIGDTSATEAILGHLKGDFYSDYDHTVRASFSALARLDDGHAISPLKARLPDWDGGFRVCVAETLGALGEPKWQEWLLGDNGDFVRLADSGDPEAIEVLLRFIDRTRGVVSSDRPWFGEWLQMAQDALQRLDPSLVQQVRESVEQGSKPT